MHHKVIGVFVLIGTRESWPWFSIYGREVLLAWGWGALLTIGQKAIVVDGPFLAMGLEAFSIRWLRSPWVCFSFLLDILTRLVLPTLSWGPFGDVDDTLDCDTFTRNIFLQTFKLDLCRLKVCICLVISFVFSFTSIWFCLGLSSSSFLPFSWAMKACLLLTWKYFSSFLVLSCSFVLWPLKDLKCNRNLVLLVISVSKGQIGCRSSESAKSMDLSQPIRIWPTIWWYSTGLDANVFLQVCGYPVRFWTVIFWTFFKAFSDILRIRFGSDTLTIHQNHWKFRE